MASLSISMEGDKQDRDALSVVARQRGISMAKLVRQSVDRECGAELKRVRSLLASSGDLNQQMVTEVTEASHA